MTFDTEKFIREIESRKAIWDISSEEYSDRDAKKRRWEEITNIMCEESLTEDEKKEYVPCKRFSKAGEIKTDKEIDWKLGKNQDSNPDGSFSEAIFSDLPEHDDTALTFDESSTDIGQAAPGPSSTETRTLEKRKIAHEKQRQEFAKKRKTIRELSAQLQQKKSDLVQHSTAYHREDPFDAFGRYIASVLRGIKSTDAAVIQQEIITLLTEKAFKQSDAKTENVTEPPKESADGLQIPETVFIKSEVFDEDDDIDFNIDAQEDSFLDSLNNPLTPDSQFPSQAHETGAEQTSGKPTEKMKEDVPQRFEDLRLPSEQDDCEAFGRYIALVIKQLPTAKMKALAQTEIQGVLTRYRLKCKDHCNGSSPQHEHSAETEVERE